MNFEQQASQLVSKARLVEFLSAAPENARILVIVDDGPHFKFMSNSGATETVGLAQRALSLTLMNQIPRALGPDGNPL